MEQLELRHLLRQQLARKRLSSSPIPTFLGQAPDPGQQALASFLRNAPEPALGQFDIPEPSPRRIGLFRDGGRQMPLFGPEYAAYELNPVVKTRRGGFRVRENDLAQSVGFDFPRDSTTESVEKLLPAEMGANKRFEDKVRNDLLKRAGRGGRDAYMPRSLREEVKKRDQVPPLFQGRRGVPEEDFTSSMRQRLTRYGGVQPEQGELFNTRYGSDVPPYPSYDETTQRAFYADNNERASYSKEKGESGQGFDDFYAEGEDAAKGQEAKPRAYGKATNEEITEKLRSGEINLEEARQGFLAHDVRDLDTGKYFTRDEEAIASFKDGLRKRVKRFEKARNPEVKARIGEEITDHIYAKGPSTGLSPKALDDEIRSVLGKRVDKKSVRLTTKAIQEGLSFADFDPMDDDVFPDMDRRSGWAFGEDPDLREKPSNPLNTPDEILNRDLKNRGARTPVQAKLARMAPVESIAKTKRPWKDLHARHGAALDNKGLLVEGGQPTPLERDYLRIMRQQGVSPSPKAYEEFLAKNGGLHAADRSGQFEIEEDFGRHRKGEHRGFGWDKTRNDGLGGQVSKLPEKDEFGDVIDYKDVPKGKKAIYYVAPDRFTGEAPEEFLGKVGRKNAAQFTYLNKINPRNTFDMWRDAYFRASKADENEILKAIEFVFDSDNQVRRAYFDSKERALSLLVRRGSKPDWARRGGKMTPERIQEMPWKHISAILAQDPELLHPIIRDRIRQDLMPAVTQAIEKQASSKAKRELMLGIVKRAVRAIT